MKPGATYRRGARFVEATHTSKLAPVDKEAFAAIGPYACTTDVSIAATCSDACPFKSAGCYVRSGRTKNIAARLDQASAGWSAEQVVADEAYLIDRAFRGGPVPQDGARGGGRDLRLHVGGDVGSAAGAMLLAGAAERWQKRRGGKVWTFTHRWAEIPRATFGRISVLASVEVPQDIEVARRAGYASAIVVGAFPSPRAFPLPGTTAKIIPCPAETRSTTCIECRLCLDADKLLERNRAIGFAAHGPGAGRVRQTLVQLRTSRQSADTGDKSDEGSSSCSSSSPVGAP